MPKRKLVEAVDVSERARQRQNLGTLRELTVQPATKKRYKQAVDGFLQFLRTEQRPLPTNKTLVDPILCDYLEHLWSSGAGRAQASDTVAGLQDVQPNLRHQLPGAWRLLKTWSLNEVPNRAPPLPEHLVHAMAGWAFFKGHFSFGTSLLLGFYTMLRSGEIIELKGSHVVVSKQDKQVLVSLGFTKGGKRQGAAESTILGIEDAVTIVKRWKTLSQPSTSLSGGASKWRSLFSECLQSLNLTKWGFRPYSLRRGGATWWFQRHQSLDRILVQGRWLAQKTARIYLNEGLAMLAEMQFPSNDATLRPFLNIYRQTVRSPLFKTLEPPGRPGRAGGRGYKPMKRKKS